MIHDAVKRRDKLKRVGLEFGLVSKLYVSTSTKTTSSCGRERWQVAVKVSVWAVQEEEPRVLRTQ